ncbi:MAG: TonB-dependent receptor [Bryobacter sp.]|nr:TonB-dependent receptor [Bryobacter sp.]
MHKVLFLLLAALLPASAQLATRIAGWVEDPSGAPILAARVALENSATGLRRETATDPRGRYAFADLPIGSYRVSVAAPGFRTEVRSGIELGVAAALTVRFQLALSERSETVEVKAEVAGVETATAVGNTLGAREMVELPINGRDYTRFSLLAPGSVARSSQLADLTFNGLHLAMNNFAIDGVDASRVDQPWMANGFERGARLLTGSIDTVAEFRVQTSNYKAEYGRSAGSSLTIVSRSGTNQWHGGLFEFLRNDFFDARNYFNAKPAAMPPFRYNNFGGNLGGPLLRDRTFVFANYEGSRQRIGATGSGTVPSRAVREQALATAPDLRPLLDNLPLGQTPTANPRVDTYVATGVRPVREDTGSIRVDHNFTDRDRLFARFNLNDTEAGGPLFPTAAVALGVTDFQQVPITTTNAVVNYTRVFSPRVLLEANAGLQRWGSQLNSDTPYPQVNITGYTVVAGSRRFQLNNSTMVLGGASLSLIRGGHTIKFGAGLWRAIVNTRTTDVTVLTYTSVDDFIRNSVNQAALTRGDPGTGRRQTHLGSYVQDTWQMRRNLTLDLGLRWDFSPPNHGDKPVYRAFDPSLLDLGAPGAPWYRTNYRNFGPRFGFSWQPASRVVLRGGYGIFYQQFAPGHGASVALNTLTGNTTLLRAQIPALKYPVEPFLSSGTSPLPSVEGFNNNKPELYTQQWNLTLAGELSRGATLQAAYVGNRGINVYRQYNLNFFDPALGRRPLSQFANVNVIHGDGQSTYHSLQVSLRQRYAAGVLGTVNYTYGKAIDNAQDYGRFNTQPQDNRCTGPCERGLGTTDMRHVFTYQALWDLPFGPGRRWARDARGIAAWLVGGWQMSSLALVRSGAATQVTIGVNTFGNQNLLNQRPDAVAGASLYPERQTIDNFFNAAAYRLPAAGTFGNLARNTLHGPDFWQFDASLAKETRLRESARLSFRAEVFNLLNRPNFDLPNSVFGTANFGRIFNTFGRTLGFGTSRQIQLSLRLTF